MCDIWPPDWWQGCYHKKTPQRNVTDQLCDLLTPKTSELVQAGRSESFRWNAALCPSLLHCFHSQSSFGDILNVCNCTEKEERGATVWHWHVDRQSWTWWNHSRTISVNIWCLCLSYWLSIFGQHKPGLSIFWLIWNVIRKPTAVITVTDNCFCGCFSTEHRRTKWSTVNNMDQAAPRYRCFSLFHWGDQEILIWGSRRSTNVSVRMAHVVSASQTAWIQPEAGSWHRAQCEIWGFLCLIMCSRVMWLVSYHDSCWPSLTSFAF